MFAVGYWFLAPGGTYFLARSVPAGSRWMPGVSPVEIGPEADTFVLVKLKVEGYYRNRNGARLL